MIYDHWQSVGAILKEGKYKKKYFTPEQYLAEQPLENLVCLPGIESFFGTKVLNIFIVGIPYGWEKVSGTWQETWPPEGLDDAKARHIAMFDKFAKYKTCIYMDTYLVDKVMLESPSSRFRDMMNATKNRLATLCTELPGFELKDDITGNVGPDYFYSLIDDFYNT